MARKIPYLAVDIVIFVSLLAGCYTQKGVVTTQPIDTPVQLANTQLIDTQVQLTNTQPIDTRVQLTNTLPPVTGTPVLSLSTPDLAQPNLHIQPDRIEGMVDIGERNLYIRCVGTGSPTIILDFGPNWSWNDDY